jgi:hypothetical protein
MQEVYEMIKADIEKIMGCECNLEEFLKSQSIEDMYKLCTSVGNGGYTKEEFKDYIDFMINQTKEILVDEMGFNKNKKGGVFSKILASGMAALSAFTMNLGVNSNFAKAINDMDETTIENTINEAVDEAVEVVDEVGEVIDEVEDKINEKEEETEEDNEDENDDDEEDDKEDKAENSFLKKIVGNIDVKSAGLGAGLGAGLVAAAALVRKVFQEKDTGFAVPVDIDSFKSIYFPGGNSFSDITKIQFVYLNDFFKNAKDNKWPENSMKQAHEIIKSIGSYFICLSMTNDTANKVGSLPAWNLVIPGIVNVTKTPKQVLLESAKELENSKNPRLMKLKSEINEINTKGFSKSTLRKLGEAFKNIKIGDLAELPNAPKGA